MTNQLVDAVALIVVLIVLVIPNFRFLRLWLNLLRKRNGLAENKKVLSGAVGWVYIGGIFVSVGIAEMLLEGAEEAQNLKKCSKVKKVASMTALAPGLRFTLT